jgi:hypothetical protein
MRIVRLQDRMALVMSVSPKNIGATANHYRGSGLGTGFGLIRNGTVAL